jgi:hypothetical protein
MKSVWRSAIALGVVALSLFAGAVVLQIGDPALNPEALKNHAVVVARVTACHSPEKTVLSATAEGNVNGARKSIPLKVISLSAAGTFAITEGLPQDGNWAVKVVATNPDWAGFATSAVIPVRNHSVQFAMAKHYFHAPTDAEVSSALN